MHLESGSKCYECARGKMISIQMVKMAKSQHNICRFVNFFFLLSFFFLSIFIKCCNFSAGCRRAVAVDVYAFTQIAFIFSRIWFDFISNLHTHSTLIGSVSLFQYIFYISILPTERRDRLNESTFNLLVKLMMLEIIWWSCQTVWLSNGFGFYFF